MSCYLNHLSIYTLCALFSLSACTTESNSHPKVINGADGTAPGHFVSLFYSVDSPESGCGGSYIGDGIIVTAAHCVSDLAERLYVGFGITQVNDFGAVPRVEVRSIRAHEAYNGETKHNDIALLFVNQADLTRVESSISTLSLVDTESDVTNGENARVIGFGNISTFGRVYSKQIQTLDIPVIPIEKCQTKYENLVSSQICAGALDGGYDTCQGDSGGPLYKILPDGELALAGLVSYGYGCAQPDAPGIYTRISSFRDWIKTTIAEERAPAQGDAAWVADTLTHRCYDGVWSQKSQNENFAWNIERTIRPDGDFAIVTDEVTAIPVHHTCTAPGASFSLASHGDSEVILATTGTKRFAAKTKSLFNIDGNCIIPPAVEGEPERPLYVWSNDFYPYTYLSIGEHAYETPWDDTTPENREGYSWNETARCERDGVTLVTETETAQEGTEASDRVRLRILGVHAEVDSRTFVMKPEIKDTSSTDIQARLLSVSESQSLLEITNSAMQDIYGIELICDKEFDIVQMSGERLTPTPVVKKFVIDGEKIVKPGFAHRFFGYDNPNAYLQAKRGLRTLLVDWKDGAKPTEQDKLHCVMNSEALLEAW